MAKYITRSKSDPSESAPEEKEYPEDTAPLRDLPVIGLSVNIDGSTSRLHEDYIRAVEQSGAAPLMIPAGIGRDSMIRIIDQIDGLILTGGADISGEYFGEQTLQGLTDIVPGRDEYDMQLLRLATDRQVPVLGICRGVQVINVAYGGTLWQDIPTQYGGGHLDHSIPEPREKPSHTVTVSPNTVLESILGAGQVEVNSRHHQAIKKIATGFRVSATSADGIIEAIESYPAPRILGVQWHPESMAAGDDNPAMKALFSFFAGEAALFKKAKSIHSKYISVDSHTDTPMHFERRPVDIGGEDNNIQVNIPLMTSGRLDAAVMVAYLPQGARDERSLEKATGKAVSILGQLNFQVEHNSQFVGIARTFEDVQNLKNQGKRSIFPGIENGYAIGREIKNIAMFRDMGVVYMTLCHNGANDLCDSAIGAAEHGGLSSLGREAVREMNRVGMVIDLSHASAATFYDVLQESSQPVICSHSSARALCDHPRNLSDEQILAIAQKDGVVQICLYRGFLAAGRAATFTDIIDHIQHVVNLAGIDHVGIGSDFDGGGGVPGCDAANGIINITVELLRRGYDEQDIAKILGGNLRRVFDKVQSSAEA